MEQQKRIAIAVERSSAYGRDFICGVAEIAEQHPEWNLVLVDPQHVAAKAADAFDAPQWFGADVSTDRSYTNSFLAFN